MGLSDKEDIEREIKGLHRMGIPTEIKPVDEQIDEYFYSRDKKKAKKILLKKDEPLDSLSRVSKSRVPDVLKITTRGFKDGVLQHNMPCPVCVTSQASYTTDSDNGFFGPCIDCQIKGYSLSRFQNKKSGWFS